MVAHTHNPGIQKANEFEASLVYIARQCLQKKKGEEKKN
jgi:hypothetical protein